MGPTDSSAQGAPARGDQASEFDLEDLLRQAHAGSSSALGAVLQRSRKYLLMVANRALDENLRAKVGASDLVQDTFVEAQRDFDRFTGETEEEVLAWLTAILMHRTANNVRHYVQTQKRTVHREAPAEAVELALARVGDRALTPAAAALARDEQRRVQGALDRMSEEMREVLVERIWHGDSFDEIGARRGRSAEAARKLWARAVKQVQALLSEIP